MATERGARLLGIWFLLASGCVEAASPAIPAPLPGEPQPMVAIPTSTAVAAAGTAPATAALAPLARDGRPPCDAAAATRKEADLALAQGRAYKAVRAIAAADKKCPATAQASWRTRLDALSALGRDDAARALAREIGAAPSPDPATATAARAALARPPPAAPPAASTLIAAALAAQRSAAMDARAQLDRGLVRLEQETSESPRAFFDLGERKALAISADGASAVLSAGNLVLLIDAKDLSPRRFFDHTKPVQTAALSADGKLLATLQSDGETGVWSTTTGKRLHRLVWTDEQARCALFSPDGKRLITAGEHGFDAPVRVWNVETGDSVEAFSLSGSGDATALSLSRDGKTVAIGTERGVIELWTLNPHKRTATLAKKDSFLEGVTSIDFSPKGDKVAAAFENGKVTVWETKLGKVVWEVATEGRSDSAAVAFSADGSRLLASGRVGFTPAIREWDSATGAELQNKPVPIEAAFFSQDGRVALGAGREELGVLDLATRTAVTAPMKGHRLRSLLFGPPRTLAFMLDSEKALRLITPGGSRFFPLKDDYGSFALSLDGRTVAQADYHEILAWDVEKGTPLAAYPSLPDSSPALSFGPQGSEIRAAFRHFDVLSLFAASPGQAAWKELFHQERKSADQLVVAAYGRSAVIRADSKVFIVDVADGRTISMQDDSTERIQDLELSGDGRVLFVMRDQKITRFDTETGKPTHPPADVGCYSSTVACSFDGARVLAACSGEVAVLTFAPAQEVPIRARLIIDRQSVDSVVMAPHGDLVAVGHEDGFVRLLELNRTVRAELIALPGADGVLVRAPDGRVLLSGKDTSKLESRLFCRVGPVAVPFVVCADALTDEGLLEAVFAPAPPD
jgi:WD40 repeat protein